ncbi:hypothetical protein TNCV_593001 [Trichonephila clavipes]|nr:hypothetical protein TNCV_593001 [Trichonephila clavipes]
MNSKLLCGYEINDFCNGYTECHEGLSRILTPKRDMAVMLFKWPCRSYSHIMCSESETFQADESSYGHLSLSLSLSLAYRHLYTMTTQNSYCYSFLP